jgi:hypothetical protein
LNKHLQASKEEERVRTRVRMARGEVDFILELIPISKSRWRVEWSPGSSGGKISWMGA